MYRHLKKLLTGVLSLTVLCAAAMPSMALDGTGNVASVDGQEYATVQEAINNGNGKTVTLLDDAKENVVIPEGATVTLELGTFTLANNGASHTITNKGTLTIQGSGKVDNENHGKAALWNEGTAVLNGGTFDRSKEAGSSAEASGSNSYYTVVNHGNMTINDGVTITQNGKFSSLLENGWYNGAENKSGQPSVLTIKGGTFSGGLNTIKNDDYGELIVEGGTFTNVAQAALLNWNEAEISGGDFQADEGSSCVILNGYLDDTMDAGKLTITGGTFTGGDSTDALNTMGGSSNSGNIQISGGTLNGDIVLGAASNSAVGTLAISGSAVVNGSVTNTKKDNVTISGGSVAGEVSNSGDGSTSITGGAFAQKPADEYIGGASAVAKYQAAGGAAAYYIGEESINQAAANAESGSTIEVLKGDVKLDITADDVIVKNSGDGDVTVNDQDVPAGDEGVVTHTHKAEKKEAKEATCTETGNQEYWYCAGCGKYFTDAACQNETTWDKLVIAAKGHEAEKTEAKAATATEAGNKEYWYCPVCGKYFSDEALTKEISKEDIIIPATGTTSSKPEDTSKPGDPTSSNSENSNRPQTGETSQFTLWVALLVLAGGSFAGVALSRSKRKAS